MRKASGYTLSMLLTLSEGRHVISIMVTSGGLWTVKQRLPSPIGDKVSIADLLMSFPSPRSSKASEKEWGRKERAKIVSSCFEPASISRAKLVFCFLNNS